MFLSCLLLLFVGCQQNSDKPRVMGTTQSPTFINEAQENEKAREEAKAAVESAKIQAESAEKTAQIEKEKALEIEALKNERERIRQERLLAEAKLKEETRLQELEIRRHALDQTHQESQSAQWILALLFLIVLLFLWFLFKQERKRRMEMHKLDVEKEVHIKEREQYFHMADKIIDKIGSHTLPKEQEEKLLSLLGEDNTKKLSR